MKSNYKADSRGDRRKKLVLSEEEIEKYMVEMCKDKLDKYYDTARNDIANQVMAVFFTALNKDFGFGKSRLLRLKESVESYFSLMSVGVFNKSFTPIDCIEYLKTEFGIDLDEENLMK